MSPSKTLATPFPAVWETVPFLGSQPFDVHCNSVRRKAQNLLFWHIASLPNSRQTEPKTFPPPFTSPSDPSASPTQPGPASPRPPGVLRLSPPGRDGKERGERAAAHRGRRPEAAGWAGGTFPPRRTEPGGQRTAPRRFRLPRGPGRQVGARGALRGGPGPGPGPPRLPGASSRPRSLALPEISAEKYGARRPRLETRRDGVLGEGGSPG